MLRRCCYVLVILSVYGVPIDKVQPPFQKVSNLGRYSVNLRGVFIGIVDGGRCSTSTDSLCLAAHQLAERTESKIVTTQTAVRSSTYIILGVPDDDKVLASIAKQRNMTVPGNKEGYQLDITTQGVVLISGSNGGCLYGAQSILQLGNKNDIKAVFRNIFHSESHVSPLSPIPTARITDFPDSTLRGANVWGSWAQNFTDLQHALDYLLYLKLNFALLDNSYGYDLTPPNLSPLQHLMQYARVRNIYLVPTLPSGDGGNPNPLTYEGKWVKNETFHVLKNDAIVSTNPFITPYPLNGNFSEVQPGKVLPANWSIAGQHNQGEWTLDVNTTPHSMKCVITSMPGTHTSPILTQTFPVDPDSTYWLTFDYKAENLKGTSYPQVTFTVVDNVPHLFPYANVQVKTNSSEWQRGQSTLITTSNTTKAYVWSRLIGDGVGTWWLTNFRIMKVDATLKNIIITNSTNIEMFGQDKHGKHVKFVERRDYTIDPPKVAHPNVVQGINWAELLPFSVRRVPTGDIPESAHVTMSYDMLPGTADRQGHSHPNCFAEPLYYETMEYYISRAIKLLQPKFLNFNHDEIRGMNRDSRSRRSGLQNYELLIKEYNTLNKIAKKYDPDITVVFWDDIINPYHNGGDPYYQFGYGTGAVGQTDTGLLESKLDKSILWLVWAYGTSTVDYAVIDHAQELYSGRGMPWIASPWSSPGNFRAWAEEVEKNRQRASSSFQGWVDTNWIADLEAPQWPGLPMTANCSWIVSSCL